MQSEYITTALLISFAVGTLFGLITRHQFNKKKSNLLKKEIYNLSIKIAAQERFLKEITQTLDLIKKVQDESMLSSLNIIPKNCE